jgi:hypothetical protein
MAQLARKLVNTSFDQIGTVSPKNGTFTILTGLGPTPTPSPSPTEPPSILEVVEAGAEEQSLQVIPTEMAYQTLMRYTNIKQTPKKLIQMAEVLTMAQKLQEELTP